MTDTTNNTYGLRNNFKQVATRYDASHEVLWSFMNQQNMVPCFNSEIVRELTEHHDEITKSGGLLHLNNNVHHMRYSVAASLTPDVFNLGGQLTLIRKLALNREKEALKNYGLKALNVLVRRYFKFGISDLTTISLLQGQTLGAGLEAALASDVIIAERKTMLGFPEIMFNLFPGMGAHSLLTRKVGAKLADEMILGGKIYTAEEAFNLGIVDVLVDDDEGVSEVYRWIEKNKKISNGFQAIQKAKYRISPITEQEMIDITLIWLDAAMRLNERDFKVMERFTRSQEKRYCPMIEKSTDNVVDFAKSAVAA